MANDLDKWVIYGSARISDAGACLIRIGGSWVAILA